MYFHTLDNNTNQNCMTHEKHLTGVFDAWNMCKHEIEGDGNCCFTAVAFGIDPSMDMQAIATQLRLKIIVSYLVWIFSRKLPSFYPLDFTTGT